MAAFVGKSIQPNSRSSEAPDKSPNCCEPRGSNCTRGGISALVMKSNRRSPQRLQNRISQVKNIRNRFPFGTSHGSSRYCKNFMWLGRARNCMGRLSHGSIQRQGKCLEEQRQLASLAGQDRRTDTKEWTKLGVALLRNPNVRWTEGRTQDTNWSCA
jgi:hypothetical protein